MEGVPAANHHDATTCFAADLRIVRPEAPPRKEPSPAQSRRYCRRLARRHYENFTVASWLLPRRLRQHFYNVYAYCRWADDLADEAGRPRQSLALLDWWEQQLRDCYRGQRRPPGLHRLGGDDPAVRASRRASSPICWWPSARTSGSAATRDFEKLLDYCRYSANPVGRLVLLLGRCHDERSASWPTSVCTGLQLANFCQDVARDYERGRIYLPLTHCRRFGFDESQFARRKANEPFRRLLAAEVAEAEGWLRRGLPLVDLVAPELKLDVALFIHGGLANPRRHPPVQLRRLVATARSASPTS